MSWSSLKPSAGSGSPGSSVFTGSLVKVSGFCAYKEDLIEDPPSHKCPNYVRQVVNTWCYFLCIWKRISKGITLERMWILSVGNYPDMLFKLQPLFTPWAAAVFTVFRNQQCWIYAWGDGCWHPTWLWSKCEVQLACRAAKPSKGPGQGPTQQPAQMARTLLLNASKCGDFTSFNPARYFICIFLLNNINSVSGKEIQHRVEDSLNGILERMLWSTKSLQPGE